MDDFYITLPSNVKSDFDTNTVANYKTKLATNLKLEGEWRVGLASISYSHAWSVDADTASFHIEHFYWKESFKHDVFQDDSFKLDLNKFEDVISIINILNSKIEDYEKEKKTIPLPRFNIDGLTRRVEIKPTFENNTIVMPKMSENLCKVLGFNTEALYNFIDEKHKFYRNEWSSLSIKEQWKAFDTFKHKEPNPSEFSYLAENPYSLSPTFRTLYIYCDLVKHNFVGDSFTQLIRIVEVPTKSKFRDQISINYINIHYMPLQVKEFDSIEIHIKDDLGKTIPFLLGRTIITLHFIKL